MSTWTAYAIAQPDPAPGLYWWRVPPCDHGGLTLQLEWAADYVHHGAHGGTWVPPGTDWTGWRLIIPAGIEWRPAEEGVRGGDCAWPGLNLLPCPFCGAAPKLTIFTHQYISAPGWLWERLSLRCTGCGLAGHAPFKDLAVVVKRWNTRHSHLRSVA